MAARKYLVVAAVIVAVFAAGYLFGSGHWHIGNSAVPANANLPARLDYSSVNQVYQELKDNFDGKLTTTQLLNGLKHGLANATGDPHTEYFTTKEAKQFDNELNNSFSGIGAVLGKDAAGDLQVVSPIKGFPADKAGVRAGDLIATINGKSTSGLSLTQAVVEIRGKEGTKVTLGLVRNEKLTSVTITRKTIEVPSVSFKVLPGEIGYIQIISFSNDTSSLAEKAAKSLRGQGVKSVILDLRGNPGGLVNAAVNVSSLWLERGDLIMQEKRGPVVDNSFYATGNDLLRGLPTVVLINGGSASASEITAGALHDHDAATLIGTKSYGKGSVQKPICLAGVLEDDGSCSEGPMLKVTVDKWYRPNGQNIDKKGIKPDQTVKLTAGDQDHGRDPQLKAAEARLAG